MRKRKTSEEMRTGGKGLQKKTAKKKIFIA